MITVDWLRLLKDKLILRINSKNSWGKNELIQEIYQIYMEVLEELVSPSEENK